MRASCGGSSPRGDLTHNPTLLVGDVDFVPSSSATNAGD
jgi:hypothetical protein